MFYKIIQQQPNRATLKISKLLEICNQIGENEVQLKLKPVITLTKIENSEPSGHYRHAVVLTSYIRSEKYLDLITIDSLSETGKTFIGCPINDLELFSQFPGECRLASDKCYYFQFN